MPPSRRGTIDSIKVGLGVDMAQLDKDMVGLGKSLDRTFEVHPKIVVPPPSDIKGWLREVQTAVNASRIGVKVPVTFDEPAAVRAFGDVMAKVQAEVRPIVVPVHYQQAASATRPSFGGPGGGPIVTTPVGAAPGGRGGGARVVPAAPVATSAPAARPVPPQPVVGAVATGAIIANSPDAGGGNVRRLKMVPPKPPSARMPWEGPDQDITGRTIRSGRAKAVLEAERRQVALINRALEGGDVGGLDSMLPGVGTAIAARSPGQIRSAYLKAVGGRNPGRVGTRLNRFGEAMGRDVASPDDMALAAQYPRDFAISTIMGAINSGRKPWLMKAGGVSLAGMEALERRLAKGESPWAMGGLRDRLMQAEVQRAMDAGRTRESQRLNLRLERSRGGWGRPSSLGDLPGVADEALRVTKVGEQGPEALVDLPGGRQFMVPAHQMGPFMKRLRGMQAGGFHVGPDAYGNPTFIRPTAPDPRFRAGGFSPFSSLDYGSTPQGVPASKVHIGATEREALQTLGVVSQVAERMGVAMKYVANITELNDVTPNGSSSPFGPSGGQAGKFITAYPSADQGRAFVEQVREGLLSAGLGKNAAVNPRERRFAADVPITHRYSSDYYGQDRRQDNLERMSKQAGYDLPGAQDFIGTLTTAPQSTPRGYGAAMSGLDRIIAAAGGQKQGGGRLNIHQVRGFSGTGWPPEGFVEPPAPAGFSRDKDWMFPAPRGRFAFRGRDGKEIKEYQQGGNIRGFGDIQRVYVVNMPVGGFGGGTPPPPWGYGGPARPSAANAPATMSGAGPTGPGGRAGTGAGGDPFRRGSAAGSQVKFAAEESVTDLSDRLGQVGIDISEALQKSPVRALSVAIGQIAQTMVGGRADILGRARVAQALERRAGVAVREQQSAAEQIGRAEFDLDVFGRRTLAGTAEEAEEFKGLQQALADAKAREAIVRPVAEERTQAAEAAAKGILTPFQQFKTQAVGLGGIVGGTLLFTTAMSAAQAGLQLMGDAAGKAGDQIDGFGFTARRVSQELADAVTQASGDIGGAVAGIAARAGVPAGTPLGAVEAQAGRLAGAMQLQQQRDLLRSQGYFDDLARRGGPVPGAGIGFNNGILGTWVQQQQGAAELVGGMFAGIPRAESFAGQQRRTLGAVTQMPAAEFPATPEEYRRQLASGELAGGGSFGGFVPAATMEDFAANLSRSVDDLRAMTASEIEGLVTAFGPSRANAPPLGSALERQLFELYRPQQVGGGGRSGMAEMTGPTPEYLAYLDEEADKKAKVTKVTDQLNRSMEKAGTGLRFIVDPEKARLFRDILESPAVGAGSYAGNFAERDVAMVDRRGRVVDARGATQGLLALLEAALAPTFEGLMRESRRQTNAQIRAQGRQALLQQELVPASAAEQLLARPFPTGALTGVTAPGVSPGSQGARSMAPAIARARAQMAAVRDEGIDTLLGLGVPQEAIDSVATLGERITALRSTTEDMQLGLEQAQYNEQLRISVRTVGDLVALTGKQGDNATRYGALQRAQIMDSRELTRIQLARSQRELNLSVALSRLQAPGETAEERAVRRDEAMLLAREQQRELDIGKRTATRGFAIQDIEFGRQLTDATKQIGLLREARAVSIEVRGIQKVIEAKEQLLSVRSAFLGVSRDAAVALRSTADQIIASMEARLGKISDAQIETIRRYVRQASRALDGMLEFRGATGGGVGRARGLAPAAGAYYPTMMGAPAGSGMGAAGGRNNVHINISASVRSDGDVDLLTRRVVREIHQQAALVGA